jgi:hypothetical protein
MGGSSILQPGKLITDRHQSRQQIRNIEIASSESGARIFRSTFFGGHMKNIYEVLRLKELEIVRLKIEVKALRVAAPLLSDDNEAGNENRPPSARLTAPSQAN